MTVHALRRSVAYLPLALVAGFVLLSMLGISLVPTSNAASTTVTIGADVGAEVHIALGTCGAAGTITGPAMATGDGETTIGTCQVTFGTNNGASAVLAIRDARPGPDVDSFCQAANGLDCAATAAFTNVTSGTTVADGQYGVNVDTYTTCSTPAQTLNNYFAIQKSGGSYVNLCTMTNTTDGDIRLEFVANPGAGTSSGTYNAQYNLQATAS